MSHLGRSVPLVPPLYTSAVYAIPDLDALDAIYAGDAPGFIYARDGHPNAHDLAAKLTSLHAGNWGVVTGSGMGALAAAVLPHVSAGDRVLLSSRLYGRTYKLLHELARFGVSNAVVDVTDLNAVKSALATGPVKVAIVETLSNPMCRACDIPAVAELCRAVGAKLVVDNTFASPVLCRPLELGADLVMESLTKIIGGHSDLMLGFLAGSDSALFPNTSSTVSTWGLAASPFECWQTLRSLETLALRVRESVRNTLRVAEWLVEQPGIVRVIYPGSTSHPDYALAQRLMPDGAGYMLCFELAGGRAAVNQFLQRTPGIPFCPSLGHATTTCSHPDTTSHRYDSPEDKRRQGITPGLIRLSVGCEPYATIVAEMGKGLVVS